MTLDTAPTSSRTHAWTGPPPFVDPIHRAPRLWSNAKLREIGHLFSGDVVNVSAWRDEDKEDGRYKEYFFNARRYAITNYRAEMRGYQGWSDELYLDLQLPLPDNLRESFDTVFNHTTLEHVYEFRTAFANLCAMSRDAVIVVAPWLQPYHGDYGDYWRFSPLAIARLFEENGFTPAQIVWNEDPGTSVYVFGVGVRDPAKWQGVFEFGCDSENLIVPPPNYAGVDALPKRFLDHARSAARAAGLGRIRRMMRNGGPQ